MKDDYSFFYRVLIQWFLRILSAKFVSTPTISAYTLNRSYKWPPTHVCACTESKHRFCKILITKLRLFNHKVVLLAWRLPNLCNVSLQRNNQIKLTHYDDRKKKAHGQQKVRNKENTKLSYGGPSQALRQGSH